MIKDKKNILITGGAGFIGSYLAEELLNQGNEVYIIDDLSTGSLENIKHLEDQESFHFIKGDILENESWEKVKNVDQIYHLAAAVGVKKIMEEPIKSFLINVDGTKKVLEMAEKKKTHVLIASSSEVYGKNEDIPFKEDADRVYGSAYRSRWGYGLSKASDEFLGLAYHEKRGVPVVIVRFFNIIGPRQSYQYGMVVPRFVTRALNNERIPIYGDGANITRCFAYVTDVIQPLIDLMNHDEAVGKIFNLGSDEEITINGLAEKIKELIGSTSELYSADDYGPSFDDMAHRKPDLQNVKDLIGYEPKMDLKQSLLKIIEYHEELLKNKGND